MEQQFDVFLSHNSADKTTIREIKQLLEERDLSAWLDVDELRPGLSWMSLLESALCNCKSAGAFVGSNGIGPWERKEIEALLIEAVDNGIPVIPVLLPGDYKQPKLPPFLRTLTYIDMRSGITPELIDRLIWGITGKKPNPTKKIQPGIYSDRLPTVKGDFFGREAELKMLNNAWADNNTHILQFIAPGGTGKTKLLRYWIDHTPDIPNLIAWSFYSQGAREDKQTSATPFFTHAFSKLGSTRDEFASEEDKGEYLAELLEGKRCLLVLDGLEPLQHSSSGLQGTLKDKAIRQLLRQLMHHNGGLCIITTRIAVDDLSDRQEPLMIKHDLQNLNEADGVMLLKSLGVKGRNTELVAAVRDYRNHALALSLLGNAISTYLNGDIRRRDTLDELIDKADSTGHHTSKVMQAYQHWLQDTPELKLLYLLGLFDHPVKIDVLQVLWSAQIVGLTDGIAERAWKSAIQVLRIKHRLLSTHENCPRLLDCHPLIREYFGRQLQMQQPESWRQAHEQLYGYYKSLPEKKLPDTLEEMQPLLSAVEHGCNAGLHQEAFDDIYYPRIRRGHDHYLYKKGAFSADLSVLAHFFHEPWIKPIQKLNLKTQASILHSAGHRLRSLGRIEDSILPFKLALEIYIQLKIYDKMAIAASNLIEPYLTLGQINEALKMAEKGIEDLYKNDQNVARRLHRVTIYARALHQSGKKKNAHHYFREAEKIQQQNNLETIYLTDLPGFLYSELLLEDTDLLDDAMIRAKESLILEEPKKNNLFIGLNKLIIGRVNLRRHENIEAGKWINEALGALRKANNQDHLPRGLLARASLHRYNRQFKHAYKDLAEVFEIAKPSKMCLHLTDYYIEMVRLLWADQYPLRTIFNEARNQLAINNMREKVDNILFNFNKSAEFIKKTGYHRRDGDLRSIEPYKLLAQAQLYRCTHEFEKARLFLQQAFNIVKPNRMQQHLTDWHLEMARLLLAEGEKSEHRSLLQGTDVGATGGHPLEYHIAEATRLIQETGYHRRDKELAELRQALQAIHQPPL